MDYQSIKTIKRGDIIEVSDFFTISACGSSISLEVKNVNVWNLHDDITVYGFEMDYEDDINLMLVARVVSSDMEPLIDFKLMRLFENGIYKSGEFNCIGPDEDDNELTFVDFEEATDEDETAELCPYVIKSNYPFWGVEKTTNSSSDTENVAICEYELNEDDCDDFWAVHSFVEWYDQLDEDGLVNVWYGWSVDAMSLMALCK